jgi:hypothetical protein
MALVDTRFNSYQPNLTVLASNNVIKLGSVITVDVRSTLSPGRVTVRPTQNYNALVRTENRIPSNIGSTTNVSIYVNSSPAFQSSNVGYRTFSLTERVVEVRSDEEKFTRFNPRIATSVSVSASQVVMRVQTVVVQEDSRIYGFRIPYTNDKITVAFSEFLAGNKKAPVIRERYVYVLDSKNENISKSIREDNIIIDPIIVNSTNETRRVRLYDARKQISISTRRTATAIQTLIKPVNVIDDANGVYSGSGAGGGGGGGGGVTEYWS